MAQAASSSQREPSMEEILASIRRIIEDNDMPRASEAVALDTAIRPAANDPVSRRAEAPAAEIAPDLAMELAGALDDEDVEIYDTSVNDLDAVIALSASSSRRRTSPARCIWATRSTTRCRTC
jgi:cell pole-organizing protein PopZ